MSGLNNNKTFEDTIKTLGLTELSTKEAINSISYGILYSMYKDINKMIEPIRLEKPVEPIRLEKPVEPIRPVDPIDPIEPVKPTILELDENILKFLSGEVKESLMSDLNKNIVEYEEAKKQYKTLKELYQKDKRKLDLKYSEEQKKYKESLSEYEKNLPSYLKQVEQYEKDLKHYLEREKQYEKYIQDKKDAIDLNERIKKVYQDWTRNEFLNPTRRNAPIVLLGPPGHGKTTAFKEASKRVAKALGMVYIEDPEDGEYIDKNTFVFSTLQLAGQVTTTSVGGIPSKNAKLNEKGEVEHFMTSLPEYRISALKKAGGGVLLFDDFPNASEAVQNGVGLQLTNEGKLNGLKIENIYMGITGNLGSAYDGTNTYKTSSALASRTQTYAVREKFEDFQERTLARVSDELGDLYVISYFELNPERFNFMEPRGERQGGFTSPRSIDNFIEELRLLVRTKGGSDDLFKITDRVGSLAISMLGIENGSDFKAYLASIKNEALPKAKEIIKTKEIVDLKLSGIGTDSDKTFMHYFKTALVSEVALAYRKKTVKLQDIGDIYFRAGLNFVNNESNVSDLFQQCVKSLCLSIPELRDPIRDNQNGYKFTREVNQEIATGMKLASDRLEKEASNKIRLNDSYKNASNIIMENFLNHGTACSIYREGVDLETLVSDDVPRRRRSM